jgi:hypothetical protein
VDYCPLAKTETLEESCPNADPTAHALKTVVSATIVTARFLIFLMLGFPSLFLVGYVIALPFQRVPEAALREIAFVSRLVFSAPDTPVA